MHLTTLLRFALLPFLIAPCLQPAAAPDDSDSPAGTWRGQSACGPGATASCRDETVVYYIIPNAQKPDVVFIQADKIVDGKAITMGSGDWQYDKAKHTLRWEMPQRVWLLNIHGKQIDGTLTMPDKSVFRRMTLKKDD